MRVSPDLRAAHEAANRAEYGVHYSVLRWLDPEKEAEALACRQRLLDSLPGNVTWACSGTKPHYGPLSPGCQTCIAGTWSCLFINGMCNARCFFCPSRQDEPGEPTTGNVQFSRPEDYADYVGKFGFTGASLSGGEPLLTLDRTLTYLRMLKDRYGDALHTWIYTNGLLADRKTLQALAETGLKEIRFNLHACGYRLEGVQHAVEHIPIVTVEVPAVPEEEARFAELLPRLATLGVAHLNLHDIRVTPHNVTHILERGYTCLHGPKVRVLESELAALRLLRKAAEGRLSMAVQYCCFPYKNPFQMRGNRLRWAPFVIRPGETLTATGAIRGCVIRGQPEDLAAVTAAWTASGICPDEWSLEGNGKRIAVVPRLLADIDTSRLTVAVSYSSAATVSPTASRLFPVQVAVNDRMHVLVERRPILLNRPLEPGQIPDFLRLTRGELRRSDVPACLAEMASCECLPDGLPEYY